MSIPRVLTIAGSDSGGGAGIQADLKTFAALGVYGMSAITAITAQNTVGVEAVGEIEPALVSRQIHAVTRDIGVDAVKCGMLVNAAIIHQVALDLVALDMPRVVVDPVMVAKSGDRLLRDDAIDALMTELLPLAMVVTPNLQEAAALTGREITNPQQMKDAAKQIKRFGPRYVVVKGGHLPDSPMDILYDGQQFVEYPGERFATPHTHGTGCTFSSAIAAGLARGLKVEEAVLQAKDFVAGAIQQGLALGRGHGPLHHFYRLYSLAGWVWKR
ncbi:MAG TPA: bifunctional hydroxymethylpyrimidine kinase/phosphomethylpyrimidine kinase [Syntrophobacteraceae bacterium]|nr:bifunctional hydroxymethylpyrimidine kinase/phosphomethylpyrimidine kinase [Syntrophobacteraceae bacterium]HBZ55095.1 bifunctional hydroxymethylpyrimidine kinase/phosphomethylpyrimidine kinase [Syntrophobacteraceae bacterium]